MNTKEILGLLGVIWSSAVCADYVISVLRNRTKPHAFTWAIWAIVVGIVAIAQYRQGAGAGSWAACISAFWCAVIFLLSLFKGEKNITRGDTISLLAGLAIIPIWQATNDALLAVFLATLIDASAYYPTIRKSWNKPFEEKLFMYASDNVRWIFALLASADFSTTTLLYPIFCLIANNSLALMIFMRRRSFSKNREST